MYATPTTPTGTTHNHKRAPHAASKPKSNSNVLFAVFSTTPPTDTTTTRNAPPIRNRIKANTRRLSRNVCCEMGAKVPARLVLYFLSWSGFLVSFMMRNDINFALVAMTRSNEDAATAGAVLSNSTTTTTSTTAADLNNNNNYNQLLNSTTLYTNMTTAAFYVEQDTVADMFMNTTVIRTIQDQPKIRNDDMYQYDWSSTVKSVIVSSFYWCYVLSQVVGGIATQYFGTKHVFGWSQFATAVCSLFMPACADLHYAAVIALRSIQGFASGLTWPAMYALVGYWIPLPERSRFMSSFQGFSIGIGLTYPLCGFLIDNFGWRYVFYTTGTLGLLWCLLWYLLAFNVPKEHPRISPEELAYIELNVSAELKDSLGMKVPWRSIYLSLPVWAIGITTFGRIWIHYIFIVCGPNFMKNMLKFQYKANGFLSGMPFICSYVSSVFFCYAADKIVLHRWLSLTNVRKVFTALSQVVPGLLIYWIGYIGGGEDDIVLLLFVWFVAVTFITASYAGAMANIVDIAPNLAGPVLAFCQTIHMSASFLSPLVAGAIVTNENSIEQWRTVFGVSSVIAILTYVVYQIYGTAEIQAWNYAPPSQAADKEQGGQSNGGAATQHDCEDADDADDAVAAETREMLKKPASIPRDKAS